MFGMKLLLFRWARDHCAAIYTEPPYNPGHGDVVSMHCPVCVHMHRPGGPGCEVECRAGHQIITGCSTSYCDGCEEKLPSRSRGSTARGHPHQECLQCDNMEWCAFWHRGAGEQCPSFKPADPASERVRIRTAPRGLDLFFTSTTTG